MLNDKCSLRRKNVKSINIVSKHEDKLQRGKEEFLEWIQFYWQGKWWQPDQFFSEEAIYLMKAVDI